MYKQIITLLMTMTCAGFLPAQVINYDIDGSFDTGDLFTRGSVSDIELIENQMLIVGNFNNPNSTVSSGAKINNNGGLELVMNYGGPKVESYLGSYIQNGNVIRRYSENGIDPSFFFEFRKPAYSSFISDAANAVLVFQDSLLLVGGIFFTDSTDLSSASIRHLCMIDSTGDPVEDFSMVRCEPFDARIHTIDTLSTGEYIIAGSFTHVNGHPANKIAKLNADFTVDTSFALELNENGTAFVQLIDAQDRIWLALPSVTMVDFPDDIYSLCRLLPDGTRDMSFNLPEIWQTTEFGEVVQSFTDVIIEDEDGTFIIGGSFEEINEVSLKGFGKMEDDGSIIINAFGGIGMDEAEWGPISEYPVLLEIKKLPDGKLLLGGRFSSFGGEPYSCLVRLQPSGYVGVDELYRGTFTVFPNPAKGAVTVDYSFVAASQNTVLNVFDYLGRKVYSEVLGARTEGKLVVNTNELPNGFYILEINQDGIQVEVNKLVIAH